MDSKHSTRPSSEGQAFRYDPLESPRSFRLLSMRDSAQQDDPIELSMSTHVLIDGQYPEYTALSYTWGRSDRTSLVFLDGVPFGVTPALLDAIQHIRKAQPCQADFWWIDMLCINQFNDKERGHQVSLMRDIFHCASRVVAWVGPEADGSDNVMRTSGLYNQDSLRLRNESIMFFTRRYWTRIWIVQELCVAKEVILLCGGETGRLDSFRDISRLGNQELQGGEAIYRNMIGRLSVVDFQALFLYNLLDLRKKFQNKGVGMGSLLTSCSQQAATDPRDRVFALLGLANDDVAREIIPDYSRSPCYIYCSAIRALFKRLSRTTGPDTAEGAKIREIATKCAHAALGEENIPSNKCDGIECGAWWCCLDIALFDS